MIILLGFWNSTGLEKFATQAELSPTASVNPTSVPTRAIPSLSPASPSDKHFALSDIALEYKRNEAQADGRYKSRRFGVSGYVESVKPDYLVLLAENVARVRAKLDAKGVTDSRSTQAGRLVTLSCVGNGTGFYALELVECHPVSGTTLMIKDKPPVFSQLPALPDYPTAVQCIISNQQGNWLASASVLQESCRLGESQDRKWLSSQWRGFDPRIRDNCLGHGKRKNSYTYLKVCLEVGGI